MDLNLRTAGNFLLKASKEANPVVKALGTGLKAGSDAAITSYNNNRAKESSSRTTGKVHSRNVESESEFHHGNFGSGNWQRAKGRSLEAAGGRSQHQHQHQQAVGSRNQHQPEGEKRCASAPCRGYQLREV